MKKDIKLTPWDNEERKTKRYCERAGFMNTYMGGEWNKEVKEKERENDLLKWKKKIVVKSL